MSSRAIRTASRRRDPDGSHPLRWVDPDPPARGLGDAYYVLVAPHNVGGQVSTAANLHVAATMPNFKIQEYFNDFSDAWVEEFAVGLPEVVDGYFALPQGPGLGVTLNEDVVNAHPKQKIHFNLFAEDSHKRPALVNFWCFQLNLNAPG